MKVEFVTCFKVTVEDNQLRNFISELVVVDNIAKLMRIYYDNSATIFNKYWKDAKHMKLKYFPVKEEVQKM